MRVPGGGTSCLGVGRSGLGALPPPTTHPFWRAAGAHYPLAVGAGVAGVGTRHHPHRARSYELDLRAVGAARGRPGGAPLAWVWGVPGPGALPPPPTRPFRRAGGAHYPLAVGAGGAGEGTRHHPHSARSCELALRAVGAARGPGRVPLAWVWGVRGWALSHPRPLVLSGVRPGPASHWLWVWCAGVGALLSLAPSAVPWFIVCCARFPGSTHPVAVVAWLLSWCRGCGRRRASLACLVAPRWCAAPRPVRSLSVLRSSFPSPWCLPPPRGLRGARGGRPRTRLFVPAAGHCRGKGAGRALRCTRLGPRDGVVPGGSLGLRSWAACAAVVWRVWTRSLTRPVSRTVHLSTGDSAGAPGLFRVDADTSPFGSEDATPGTRACVRVRALLGRAGRAGLLAGFWCASAFPVAVLSFFFVRPPPGLGRPVCCAVFFFCLCAPVVSGVPSFPGRGALGLGVLFAPPPFFFLSFLFFSPPPALFSFLFFCCSSFVFRPWRLSFFFFFPLLCLLFFFAFFLCR